MITFCPLSDSNESASDKEGVVTLRLSSGFLSDTLRELPEVGAVSQKHANYLSLQCVHLRT